MGLFSFIKGAGEKLFGKSEETKVEEAAEANSKAAGAIQDYIAAQNLDVENVSVRFDGATGQVAVSGSAGTQEDKEKVTLCCGNVAGVSAVDNNMTVTNPEPEAQYHDVVSGDTLSGIAKKYYGNANRYMVIFEANKPMLSDPDKIYPGQKLRIPAVASA